MSDGLLYELHKDIMLLTKYGTLMGDIPGFLGRVFWVSPSASFTLNGDSVEASDNNTGLQPQFALRTIQAAINLATASAGDVIALLPGTHTSAAQVTITKAGLTFIGVSQNFRDRESVKPYPLASKVNWTSTLAGTAVALSVADCTFIGINMIPVTARTFMTLLTCPRTVFIDCAVTLSAAASTSTKGLVASGGSSANCHFVNCAFMNTVATSAQGPALDITGLDAVLVEDCLIAMTGTSSAWAVAVQCGSGTAGTMRRCALYTYGAGTMTIGVDGTGVTVANSFNIENNKCGVSPGAGAYKNFDADSVSLVFNHLGTVSGGTGGTLSTVGI